MTNVELTRQRILREALALVNREGFDALTIRRLAQALGVDPTDLYSHVPHQANLLDGLQEAILWGLEPPPGGTSWQALLVAQAEALWRQLTRHPNAIVVFGTRPAASRAVLQQLEALLGALVEAGLAPKDALMAFRLVFSFVIGHAIYRFAPGTNTREVDYATLPSDHFPRLSGLSDLTRTPQEELEIGVRALVDGLSHQLERR